MKLDRAQLLACCGSTRWVDTMLAEGEIEDDKALFDAAERAFDRLDRDDWLEAFSHHPRIGDSSRMRKEAEATRQIAANEQAGATRSSRETLDALAKRNQEYEARFGHVYLVCATGKTGEEMLALLEARLSNDAATELAIAADEQRKITRIRLNKLLENER